MGHESIHLERETLPAARRSLGSYGSLYQNRRVRGRSALRTNVFHMVSILQIIYASLYLSLLVTSCCLLLKAETLGSLIVSFTFLTW
jgi:hypothetical protein